MPKKTFGKKKWKKASERSKVAARHAEKVERKAKRKLAHQQSEDRNR